MDTDLLLTIGILVTAISFPSLLSAWAESRVPRLGLVLLAGGVGLVVLAVTASPLPYRLQDVPTVMLEVFARLVN